MLSLTLDQKKANFFCHCCHEAIRRSRSILQLICIPHGLPVTVFFTDNVRSSSPNTSFSASHYSLQGNGGEKKQNSLQKADMLCYHSIYQYLQQEGHFFLTKAGE